MACFFLFSWLLPSTYTKEIWNHQTIWNITTKIYKSRLPQRYTNDCYPKSIQITCPKPPKYIKNIAYNINKRLLLPSYIKLLSSRYISMTTFMEHSGAQPRECSFMPKKSMSTNNFLIGLVLGCLRYDKNRAYF